MNNKISRDDLIIIFSNHIEKGLFKSDTIRNFNSQQRRIYRLIIVEYFSSAICNEEPAFNEAQFNLSMMYMTSNIEFFEKTKYEDSLKRNLIRRKFKFIDSNGIINDSLLNETVNFFKTYSNDLKKGRTIYLYKDVKEFWDINELYKSRGIKNIRIANMHSIEFQIFMYSLPVHTYPEFFAFQDLINLWNSTIQKFNLIKDKDVYTDHERSISHSYHSHLRMTLISGVHFFETYLYYLYYSLRETNINNKLLKANRIRSITDLEIIEKCLYEIYPTLKNKSEDLLLRYKEVLKYRDAFVHMSAFFEDGFSRMQYLTNYYIEKLCEDLDLIIRFIDVIENELPLQHKILFWKSSIQWPDFSSQKEFSNLKID